MYPTYEGVLIMLAVIAAIPLCHAVALLLKGVSWLRDRAETPTPSAERLPILRQPHNSSRLSRV